ncbi:MAG: hypothetical protein RBT15_03485 [Gudongella sp.]|jgi:hypothetical protein|nr:hypothetical protein [Gudongella sp.]
MKLEIKQTHFSERKINAVFFSNEYKNSVKIVPVIGFCSGLTPLGEFRIAPLLLKENGVVAPLDTEDTQFIEMRAEQEDTKVIEEYSHLLASRI